MLVKSEVKLSSLVYIILWVKDTTKSVEFYRDVLGLKVKTHDEGWVELETGSTILALHQEDKSMDSNKKGSGNATVVFPVENIQAAYEYSPLSLPSCVKLVIK